MLKKTPAILMALYEIDLLAEDVALKWHGKEPGAQDEAGRQVREAAAPFIEWLKTAPEESSEESSADETNGTRAALAAVDVDG
jgi:translation initiation factor 5